MKEKTKSKKFWSWVKENKKKIIFGTVIFYILGHFVPWYRPIYPPYSEFETYDTLFERGSGSFTTFGEDDRLVLLCMDWLPVLYLEFNDEGELLNGKDQVLGKVLNVYEDGSFDLKLGSDTFRFYGRGGSKMEQIDVNPRSYNNWKRNKSKKEDEKLKQKHLESANCILISETGEYSFPTVKGNSSETIRGVKQAKVLWESFGTSDKPKPGDLIQKVSYRNGAISFKTNDVFRDGNALIAAIDKKGKILWSWHIWLCSDGIEEIQYSKGILMDRNLGATSAQPGRIESFGLLYQWGRKDPFLGYGTNEESKPNNGIESAAKSTTDDYNFVKSSINVGTIEYSITHPTTFIGGNRYDGHWLYRDSDSNDEDNQLWSDTKTIYDPCPAGWRIPSENILAPIIRNYHQMGTPNSYDSINKGLDLGWPYCSPNTWYPISGAIAGYQGILKELYEERYFDTDAEGGTGYIEGKLMNRGDIYYEGWGYLLTTNPFETFSYSNTRINVYSDSSFSNAGCSVRCQKE